MVPDLANDRNALDIWMDLMIDMISGDEDAARRVILQARGAKL